MQGFVVNPRRAPRAHARCHASVLSGAGVFQADTEDVGAHGCQLVGARPARSGERVQLEISNELVTGPLRVAGTIAWASEVEPWRLGVAYEEPAFPRAQAWFERLVASHPGVGAFRRVPDRIPADALVYLGPPPRHVADFSADELRLLRAVGDGIPVHELVSLSGARWLALQRAFFSLLAHQHLTLIPRHAVLASAWAAVLEDAERSLPAASPAPEAQVAGPVAAAEEGTGAAVAARAGAVAAAAAAVAAGAPVQPAASRSGPDFVGAGVGWRGAAGRPRSADAQQCLELARAEMDRGHLNGALALLRRALALAPGDAEIAGVLGRLAFRDRWGGR